MNLRQKILIALEHKPLSNEELAAAMGMLDDAHEYTQALYYLREQDHFIERHPIIGSGCKTCMCEVSYKWRLTISGRRELRKEDSNEHE